MQTMQYNITIEVETTYVREQSLPEQNRFLFAYTITITNTGNQPDTVTLSRTADQGGWKATLSASSVTLGPGQSATLDLTVTAPAKKGSFSVTVTGTSVGDGSRSDTSVASTTST